MSAPLGTLYYDIRVTGGAGNLWKGVGSSHRQVDGVVVHGGGGGGEEAASSNRRRVSKMRLLSSVFASPPFPTIVVATEMIQDCRAFSYSSFAFTPQGNEAGIYI